MKVTILGSGTFIPELNRNSSGYLIEDNEKKIILDFGRGVIDSLLKLKIELLDLDKIFISHMHADHASELASFIHLILSAPDKEKLKEKCVIYGPGGIKEDIGKLLESFHMDRQKNLKRIETKEISSKEIINLGELKIEPFKTNHGEGIMNCYGYVIRNKDKKICYSGDSGPSEELEKACEDSDLAIIEATGPKEWWYSNEHLDGEEVGKIASKAKVKNLVVTHVAKSYLSEVEEKVRESYKGEFSIAKDLMKIIV